MHAAEIEEIVPTRQEGEAAVTQVAATNVVHLAYRYRTLQCAAAYRSTVHCVALLYTPL
jgi:hypothetical protein